MPSEELPALVADVGGTNIRFALALRQEKTIILSHVENYEAGRFFSFEEAISFYFNKVNIVPQGKAASIAICTAVTGDEVVVSKLNWKFSQKALLEKFGFAAFTVCNDLEALMCSVDLLPRREIKELLVRPVQAGAPRVVVAAGTGFGMAFDAPLTGERRAVFPSEGGLSGFAPGNEREFQLLKYCFENRAGFRIDDLVSGPGLSLIYRFLRDSASSASQDNRPGEKLSPAEISKQGRGAGADPLCREARKLFLELYGRTIREAALSFLPFGGLYIAGNIALQFDEKEWQSVLQKFFEPEDEKVRVLREMPLYLLKDVHAPLVGAAARLKIYVD